MDNAPKDEREHVAQQAAHTAKLKAAGRRVAQHPYSISMNRQLTLRASLMDIVVPNYEELMEHLATAQSSWELAHELTQNVRASPIADDYLAKLGRLLHNYLASNYTLYSHAEVISNTRAKKLRGSVDSVMQPWWDGRTALLADPDVAFVDDLRHFIQHFTQVPIVRQMSLEMSAGKVTSGAFTIRVESAGVTSRRMEWSEASMALLASTESIDLTPAVEKHCTGMRQLYIGVMSRLGDETHHLESDYNGCVVAYNAALTGADIATATAITEEVTLARNSPEEPAPFFDSRP